MTHIVVFGAGNIGCYVGGRLAASGVEVTFVGRQRLAETLRAKGLTLTDLAGARIRVEPERIAFATDASALAGADIVLLAVKSADTLEAAETLASHAPKGVVVVSLQNGVDNCAIVRKTLPGQTVLGGMVPFNVVQLSPGSFHQATEGDIVVEAHGRLDEIEARFAAAGLPMKRTADIAAVQWAKLLINLNNAINALSGLPIKAQLSDRDYRRCFAMAQDEALALLGRAGISPARLTPVPPRWVPTVLRLPDFLFTRLASKMLAIDPTARTSMAIDLAAGRLTEVDWLNGAIMRLANSLGDKAPVNATLVRLIHDAETGAKTQWKGPQLLAELQRQA